VVGELLDQAAQIGGTHVVPSFLTLGALLLAGAAFVILFRGTRWTLRHAEAPRAQPAAVVAPDDDRTLRLSTIAGLAPSDPSVDREQPKPAAEGRASSRPGLASFLSTIPGVPITLFALDRAGSFTFVDGHGFAPLGWRPAELLEWTPAEIVARLPGLIETLPRVLAGESGTMTWVVPGEVFDVHYAPLVVANAEMTGMIGVAIDVTERVKQEEQSRQQSDALHAAYEALQQTQVNALRQERLYAVGTMASGMVHHLNNSLTTVLGYTEMLLERSQLWEDREVREKYLGLIQKGGKDAVRVLARLRDFYRPVRGGEPLVAVDLVDAVEQAIDLARPRWHDQAALHGQVIEIVKDLSPVPPIEGNPAELRDALTNLIFNAVEAIPATGTIAIQTRHLDDRVILEVADTGVGMTEDVRLHCFDPFFTTKKDRGIGLGLATVYGVVRRYRGTIDVESAPGRGTTFTIGFPACSAAPSSPAPLASEHAPRRRR
jgi:signal transduction histidine kinase